MRIRKYNTSFTSNQVCETTSVYNSIIYMLYMDEKREKKYIAAIQNYPLIVSKADYLSEADEFVLLISPRNDACDSSLVVLLFVRPPVSFLTAACLRCSYEFLISRFEYISLPTPFGDL